MAQADAERREGTAYGLAHELPRRRQPGMRGVVVGTHRSTEDEQRIVLPELGGEVVTGVRTAHVQGATGLDQPLADPRGWAVVLVLDDQDPDHHGASLVKLVARRG